MMDPHGRKAVYEPRQGIARNFVFEKEDIGRPITVKPSSDTLAWSKNITRKSSENLHLLVNETSMALYRIEENIVDRAIPDLKNIKNQVDQVAQTVEDTGVDVGYTANLLQTVDIVPQLQNIQAWLKNSLKTATQIRNMNEKLV